LRAAPNRPPAHTDSLNTRLTQNRIKTNPHPNQVFPSLYASLRSKRRFNLLLLSSFGLVMTMYGCMAVLG